MKYLEKKHIPLKLELRFSDFPMISMVDFLDLIKSLDQINNISHLIYGNDNLEKMDVSDYSIDQMNDFIGEENSLQFVQISKQSPLALTIVVSSVGAFLTILHIAREIRNWNINREKAELELEKLKYEKEGAYYDLLEKRARYEVNIRKPENDLVLNQITEKLSNNKLQLEDIKVPKDQSMPHNVQELTY